MFRTVVVTSVAMDLQRPHIIRRNAPWHDRAQQTLNLETTDIHKKIACDGQPDKPIKYHPKKNSPAAGHLKTHCNHPKFFWARAPKTPPARGLYYLEL